MLFLRFALLRQCHSVFNVAMGRTGIETERSPAPPRSLGYAETSFEDIIKNIMLYFWRFIFNVFLMYFWCIFDVFLVYVWCTPTPLPPIMPHVEIVC